MSIRRRGRNRVRRNQAGYTDTTVAGHSQPCLQPSHHFPLMQVSASQERVIVVVISQCQAQHCPRRCPAEFFMCQYHWSLLTPTTQKEVFTSYRPGQLVDQHFSPAWVAATEIARQEVARLEQHFYEALHRIPASLLAQRFLLTRHELKLSRREVVSGLFGAGGSGEPLLLAIEQGIARPTYPTLVALAWRLGKSVTYFLGEPVTFPNE